MRLLRICDSLIFMCRLWTLLLTYLQVDNVILQVLLQTENRDLFISRLHLTPLAPDKETLVGIWPRCLVWES